MIRLLSLVGLVLLTAVVIYDSSAHFDRDLVDLKRKHRSDQRNWSLYYPQSPVWRNSAFRYREDIDTLTEMIEPGSLVLSDLATSYVAAATLPVYVINVHRHQGRWQRSAWQRLLDQRHWCYLESGQSLEQVQAFLHGRDDLDYVILNHDRRTRHRRTDCLAARSEVLRMELPKISTRVFTGDYLELYKLD